MNYVIEVRTYSLLKNFYEKNMDREELLVVSFPFKNKDLDKIVEQLGSMIAIDKQSCRSLKIVYNNLENCCIYEANYIILADLSIRTDKVFVKSYNTREPYDGRTDNLKSEDYSYVCEKLEQLMHK